ncbi:MAG TPA: 2-dehydropantoate 2-reductase N-terminal domain-containing protein, partial [Ramlibacter sp.]|nr:2-dehydropantoate 2-reductase N-terminal domain-containing protein [Ramlibacter sp.]
MTLRCCIVGAGAIGTHLAVKLAASGADVCVLARGDTLAAIGRDGLALETDHGVLHARVPASSDPNGLG